VVKSPLGRKTGEKAYKIFTALEPDDNSGRVFRQEWCTVSNRAKGPVELYDINTGQDLFLRKGYCPFDPSGRGWKGVERPQNPGIP